MFHRIALVYGLIMTSVVLLDQNALANTVDVPFSGTVPYQATFSNATSGIAESTFSGGSRTVGNVFESVSAATIDVQSSQRTKITISPPRFVSGVTPDPAGTNHVAFLKFGSTTARSDVAGGTATIDAGITNLQIDMLVQRPVNFPPGNYSYAVTLTVTP
jgi:hypothetical protein